MVAVLYAKQCSVYCDLAVDVWDEARDARLYPGGKPVIAHPPCRAWGRFAQWAKPADHERGLALHALACVRAYGGVLEHPRASKLWKFASLPRPGEPPDKYGGYTLEVNQVDWGHRAIKPTWLYIVGCPPDSLLPLPPPGVPTKDVEHMWRGEREATPLLFAQWLIHLANVARKDFWIV